MVQVPDASPVTTPELLSTEQIAGVVLLYLTGRLELAVAETVAVASSTAGVGAAAKRIVWVLASTFEPSSPPQPQHPHNATEAKVVNAIPTFTRVRLFRATSMGFSSLEWMSKRTDEAQR